MVDIWELNDLNRKIFCQHKDIDLTVQNPENIFGFRVYSYVV